MFIHRALPTVCLLGLDLVQQADDVFLVKDEVVEAQPRCLSPDSKPLPPGAPLNSTTHSWSYMSQSPLRKCLALGPERCSGHPCCGSQYIQFPASVPWPGGVGKWGTGDGEGLHQASSFKTCWNTAWVSPASSPALGPRTRISSAISPQSATTLAQLPSLPLVPQLPPLTPVSRDSQEAPGSNKHLKSLRLEHTNP